MKKDDKQLRRLLQQKRHLQFRVFPDFFKETCSSSLKVQTESEHLPGQWSFPDFQTYRVFY